MKFSIVGTGFIFPAHVEAIREVGGEIRDIVNDIHGSDKWKEMIKDTDADCIVVLTPNDLHFEITKFAAENGKMVLCEKPLAIKSSDAKELEKYPNIYSVLQLRYHPDVEKIKSEIKKDSKNEIEMDISVYRNEGYYNGWKGKKERSGGPLFNLGVHYFDLLLFIFGNAKNVSLNYLDEKTGRGKIEGENYICNFIVSTGAEKENQKRIFKINGKQYNFSSKENLSFENFHKFVYEDLINGKGVEPKETLKSIELIENLYNSYGK